MVLEILLNLGPNTDHKQNRFSKTLLEKNLKFILYKGDNIVIFNLDLVLLLTEVNSIQEEQDCKKNALVTYDTSCIKIILVLLIKIVSFYMQALIV